MKEYPSNSITDRNGEPQEKVKRVASGRLIRSKKPILLRLLGENAKDVLHYAIYDILGPAIQTTVVDMIQTGIEMIVYGNETPSKNIKRKQGRSIIQYNSLYDSSPKGRKLGGRTDRESRNRNIHRFDEVILDSRGDAELVLETLVELIERYGLVTVGAFYDACGLESNWADSKWGWDDLSQAEVRRVRGGYCIKLPKAQLLD